MDATVHLGAGARLGSLRVDGRELLVTAPQGPLLPELSYGCFLMAPWAGRLAGGELLWEGVHRFPPNLDGHAIHGLVASRPWRAAAVSPTTVVAHLDLEEAGWPFGGRATQRYDLGERSLRMEARVEGGVRPFPVSLGWHPWFRREGDPVVAVEAAETLELGPDKIPTGRRVAVDARTDLRGGAPLGDRGLDDVYVDARSPASVAWPDLELTVRWGPAVTAVVVFCTGAALCVEPQTAWPDAPSLFRRGVRDCGLVVLQPGGVLEAWQEWSWRRPGGEEPDA